MQKQFSTLCFTTLVFASATGFGGDLDYKISAGYFSDGNVSESTVFQSSSGPGGPSGSGGGGPGLFLFSGGGGGGPGPSGNRPPPGVAPSGTAYSDQGSQIDATIDYAFAKIGDWDLSLSVNGSGNFHQAYSTYDYESAEAGLEIFKDFKTHSLSFEFDYLDTFYQGTYYQDYFKLTPIVKWKSEGHDTKIALVVAKYATTRTNSIYATPTVSRKWKWSFVDFTLGVSPTVATGDKATYSGIGPATSQASGTAFSHYWSAQPFIEFEKSLSTKWSLDLSASADWIYYEKEDLPGPVVVGVSTEARTDTTLKAGLTVNYALIEDALKISLTGEYTTNQSTGFQGLPSGGPPPSTSYNRPYVIAKLTYNN